MIKTEAHLKTALFALFVFSIFLLTGCAKQIANIDSNGSNIICFGDSLTEGIGAGPGEDFPSLLAKKLKYPVINAGRHGNTTRDALARINEDVLEKNPRLVIVEFGANDFFQRIPKQETFSNLDKIVGKIQKNGSMVAVAAVKIGLLTDEYAGDFKKVAVKNKAIFIPNIMQGILSDARLKSDGLHPNSKGYALIAERIFKRISPFLQ